MSLGRRKALGARLTLEEEAALRSFAEAHKLSLSEALRLAVARLNEQDKKEQLARQVGQLSLQVQDLQAARDEDREALRRVAQLLVISITSNQGEQFKNQALGALAKIFPESQEE